MPSYIFYKFIFCFGRLIFHLKIKEKKKKNWRWFFVLSLACKINNELNVCLCFFLNGQIVNKFKIECAMQFSSVQKPYQSVFFFRSINLFTILCECAHLSIKFSFLLPFFALDRPFQLQCGISIRAINANYAFNNVNLKS